MNILNIRFFNYFSILKKFYYVNFLIILFIIALACFFTSILLSSKPNLFANVEFGRVVVDSKGEALKISTAPDGCYRLPIKLEHISSDAARALIFYEDRHFYSHPGINPLAFGRAFFSFMTGGRRMGASTITMQVARLAMRLKTSSISGKLTQIWQALRIERHYSKDEILEAYFNLAPYGGNIEGIEAAARIYFHKPASMLTKMEGIALAIVPQNPNARNPARGKDFLPAMARLANALDDGAKVGYKALKVYSPAELPFVAPHLSLELLASKTGGNSVVCAGIERDLQLMLEVKLRRFVEQGKRKGILNCAAIIVDWRDVKVRATVGSADFGNAAISGQIDGTRARRSPGSTLKPFIYALALEQGLIHPMTMLADSPRSFGGYDPENFDRGFRGPVPAHEALKASRNLPAITLSAKLGRPDLYEFMNSAGIILPNGKEYYGLALALGGAEISMRELGALYAMLARQGIWRPLAFADDDSTFTDKRLLSPEASFLTLWMLTRDDIGVMSGGQFLPCRYKTGTSNGFKDAWTAGIVGNYVLVAWVGNFDNTPNPYFVGAETALPLFMEISRSLGQMRHMADFLVKRLPDLNLTKTEVCASTGDYARGRCRDTEETYIIPGVSPLRDSGVLKPLLLDRATGLRACDGHAGNADLVWWEFWPSDMRAIFSQAGIYKPQPPEWLPECGHNEKLSVHGRNPRILLPKKNVVYHKKSQGENFSLPLLAAAEADASKIYWYSGPKYLGSSKPGEILFWHPQKAGQVELLAVDDLGRGVNQKCLIDVIP